MTPDPDNDRITVEGERVFLDGKHLCRAVSIEAASVIGIVLAYAGNERRMPFGWKQRVKAFLA